MSKFSTLPDIDLTSVDVYETASSPELKPTKTSRGVSGAERADSDLSSDEEDEDGGVPGSPSQSRRRRKKKDKKAGDDEDGRATIDDQGIRSEEARQRFQGSTQVRRGGPSSSSHTRRKHPEVTYVDSDIYELESASDRRLETPLARLRRLRLETEELEHQLAGQGEQSGSSDKTATITIAQAGQPSTDVLLAQVRALRAGLNRVKPESAIDAASQASAVEEARNLLHKLHNGHDKQQTDGGTAVETALPVQAGQATELAEVEERLANLESIVGSTQGILEETQSLPRPLLPTLARLEHLSTLLSQPRHIDAISKRIKLLVSELDRVYESRRKLAALPPGNLSSTVATLDVGKSSSGKREEEGMVAPLDPITLSKLDDLFALSSRIQPLLPLAPSLLARLRSLSTLHASASHFSASLDSLQASQGELKGAQEEMRKALSTLEESMASNEERVKANLEAVMARLESLDVRIKDL